MKKTILTGDRPTGPLHLGHYIGSLKNRVELQNDYNQFVLVADAQALTDNWENPKLVQENIIEVALDYLAVGLDPKKTTFVIQSMIPEIAELTMFYLNLVTVNRLQHNPTVKTEIKQKGFEKSLPCGFFMYPVSQAADITIFKAHLVPVGEDQRPMIEQTNEIVRNFNRIYKTNVFPEVEALIPDIARLPGIDGKTKMSKSLGNAIYLGEESKSLSKKIKKMFTDPNKIHLEDPGTVEGHTVFTYLDIFDPDQEELESLKQQYQKGGLGDGTLKQRLDGILQDFITPIRTRREEFAKDKGEVLNQLREGSLKAREVAAQTMDEVKKAMHLKYW